MKYEEMYKIYILTFNKINEAVRASARINMYCIPNILKDIHINFRVSVCVDEQ